VLEWLGHLLAGQHAVPCRRKLCHRLPCIVNSTAPLTNAPPSRRTHAARCWVQEGVSLALRFSPVDTWGNMQHLHRAPVPFLNRPRFITRRAAVGGRSASAETRKDEQRMCRLRSDDAAADRGCCHRYRPIGRSAGAKRTRPRTAGHARSRLARNAYQDTAVIVGGFRAPAGLETAGGRRHSTQARGRCRHGP
jgi:hypothetical protein